MVVFTCGHCGDSVNKPKVEKHYLTRCRGRQPNLSCMDCFKDFYGDEHSAHTKCVSEEQRYGASGFVAAVKKGESRQDTWVELVQRVLEERPVAGQGVLTILQEVSKHSNTPRKKPKFINFVKNVCGHRTAAADMDKAWELVAAKLEQLRAANQQKQQQQHKQRNDEATTTHELHQEKKEGDEEATIDTMKEETTLTKKQRKEEKKRRKYEAELQAAAAAPGQLEDDDLKPKKKKKNKLRQEETVETAETQETNGDSSKTKKGKKRKRDMEKDNKQTEDGETVEKKNKTDADVSNGNTKEAKKSKQENGGRKNGEGESFDWQTVIITLLRSKGGEMPHKRLHKKIMAEYESETGRAAGERERRKLEKRLRACAGVVCDKDRVVLAESVVVN